MALMDKMQSFAVKKGNESISPTIHLDPFMPHIFSLPIIDCLYNIKQNI